MAEPAGRWNGGLMRRLFRLAGREPNVADDVGAELETHLALKADALIAQGMSPDAAHLEARRQFGAVEQYAAACRSMNRSLREERRRMEIVTTVISDFRTAIRSFRRAPGFAVLAVIVLAVGIGQTAAVFSVVDTVVLRPLAFPHPEQLVAIYSSNPGRGLPKFAMSPPDFLDLVKSQGTMSAVAARAAGGQGGLASTLTGLGPAMQLPLEIVTEGFFRVFGVPPLKGRTFVPSDFSPGSPRVVVISYDLWINQLGSDSKVLNRTLTLDGDLYRIVGVMPRGFALPPGHPAFWTPFIEPADVARHRGAHYLDVVGRMREGVDVGRANADIQRISTRLSQEYPETNRGWSTQVLPLKDEVVGDLRQSLLLLLAAVGMVLLVACANVVNLLLVRVQGRTAEVAVRAALGASRGRLIAQVGTEVVALGILGAIAGIPLAIAGVSLIRRWAPGQVPRLEHAGVDLRVLLFTAVLTMIVALVVSFYPAWRQVRPDLRAALAQGGAAGMGRRRRVVQRGLIVVEAALALLLLVGSGLLAASLQRIARVDPGLDPSNTLVLSVSFPEKRYPTPDRIVAAQRELLDQVRAVPGVRSAGLIFGLPLSGFFYSSSFTIDGNAGPADGTQSAQLRGITAGYLETLRVPIIRGRGLTDADRRGGQPVVLVNQAAARQFWPDGDPLGHHLQLSATPSSEAAQGDVVGVVGDVKDAGLHQPTVPTVYLSMETTAISEGSLVVRSDGNPLDVAGPIRAVIARLDPDVPIVGVETMASVVERSYSAVRFRAWLMMTFAMGAALLAAVGIYGVTSHVIVTRFRELGLRRALGASHRQLIGQAVRSTVADVGIGIVVGLVLAWIGRQAVSGLLFGVEAGSPIVWGGACLVFVAVAAVASWLPARRVARVDPATVLKT